MMRHSLLALALFALELGAQAQASTIYNAPGGSDENYWGPSSNGNQTYGQTFQAPQAILQDYSVDVSGTNGFTYVTQIYAWNTSSQSVVGSALFTSAILVAPANDTWVTSTPGITLTLGREYVALVTSQPGGISLGGTGLGKWALSSVGVTASNYWNFAEGNPTAGAWFCSNAEGCGGTSLAFRADFADAVPEPASIAVLGVGLLGVVLVNRRRAL